MASLQSPVMFFFIPPLQSPVFYTPLISSLLCPLQTSPQSLFSSIFHSLFVCFSLFLLLLMSPLLFLSLSLLCSFFTCTIPVIFTILSQLLLQSLTHTKLCLYIYFPQFLLLSCFTSLLFSFFLSTALSTPLYPLPYLICSFAYFLLVFSLLHFHLLPHSIIPSL